MIIVNNRDKVEWKEGMTVQDLLDEMGYHFRLITVTVNDDLVSKYDYGSLQLSDNAKVGVFHLAHGG